MIFLLFIKSIFFSSLGLIMILFLLSIFWLYLKKGKKFLNNREKGSSFECGFDKSKVPRLPFSLRFFLLLIFFLIFDMEIILLLGLPFLMNDFFFKIKLMVLIFLWILFLGILEEWRRGALNWKS